LSPSSVVRKFPTSDKEAVPINDDATGVPYARKIA
jgi:hypothetical protein